MVYHTDVVVRSFLKGLGQFARIITGRKESKNLIIFGVMVITINLIVSRTFPHSRINYFGLPQFFPVKSQTSTVNSNRG